METLELLKWKYNPVKLKSWYYFEYKNPNTHFVLFCPVDIQDMFAMINTQTGPSYLLSLN